MWVCVYSTICSPDVLLWLVKLSIFLLLLIQSWFCLLPPRPVDASMLMFPLLDCMMTIAITHSVPSPQSITLSDSVREKAPEELYGVILAKDNRIYELGDKVSQLEATVVDLKVNRRLRTKATSRATIHNDIPEFYGQIATTTT